MASLIVVEDEVEISLIVSEIIRENGHFVRCAKNAQLALEMLQNEWADLIITDVIIPAYGLDYLLNGLQKLERQPHLLIFSGASDEILERYSTYPILKKPHDFQNLLQKIYDILKQ